MNLDFSELERCEQIGRYIKETGATVREAARHFGISKSTVHKDVTAALRSVDIGLYRQVDEILQRNKRERHLRGGEATRRKYQREQEKRLGNRN